MSRREFLAGIGKLAATGTAVGLAGQLPVARAFAASGNSSVNVGIVGAGLAGLACADELTRNKISFTLYEASKSSGVSSRSASTNCSPANPLSGAANSSTRLTRRCLCTQTSSVSPGRTSASCRGNLLLFRRRASRRGSNRR